MLGYTQHAERRRGLSDYEEALVVEGELEPVEELAVHDGEKDCVAWRGFAGGVRAIAKDNAKGVGFLMPSTASVPFFFGSSTSVSSLIHGCSNRSVRLVVVSSLPSSLAIVRPRVQPSGFERS